MNKDILDCYSYLIFSSCCTSWLYFLMLNTIYYLIRINMKFSSWYPKHSIFVILTYYSIQKVLVY